MSMSYLEAFKEQIYSCLRCGTCRGDCVIESSNVYNVICPIYLVKPFEAYTPRGKMLLARAYFDGKVPPQSLLDYIFMCTNCNNCTIQCRLTQVPRTDYKTKQLTEERLLDPTEIVEAFKAELALKGVQPEKHKRFAEWGKKEHNPYIEPHEKRFAWLPEEIKKKLPKQAKYVYFVGCTSSYRTTEIAKATVELFEKLGIDYTFIDEWCCGSPYWRTGSISIAQEMARHNIEEIEKTGAEYVITSCAGCYRALKVDYSKRVPDQKLNAKVIHTAELLHELVKAGKLKFKEAASIRVKAAFHDPCHTGRHIGLYDVPREVASAIPGVKLIEMLRSREGSLCCGSGGGVKSAYPDIALKLAEMRIKEALEVGADHLLSICPFCKRNFDDANKTLGNPIKVIDLVELVLNNLA
ncbi:MAG: hypothetical protein DRJ31_06265 [Candidatus Methanomethylicota archaeon]|uniref:(Fe-S)-binding protein n=1 Tax=Thermoproteota archaeon TaxID=2056631 RepID=A0A497ENY3_9CREN|nr:MAG: hypothetical protein DRJ31_06265 [Candidatus Verstraetearchaeota archaeon]